MEKNVVQKLVDVKSERVSYEAAKGKSVVWKHFLYVKVDGTAVPYVKCEKCHSVLQWKSRDGTSGLRAHVDDCNSSRASHTYKDHSHCQIFSRRGVAEIARCCEVRPD